MENLSRIKTVARFFAIAFLPPAQFWHQEMEPLVSETEISPAFKQLLDKYAYLFPAYPTFSGVRELANIRVAHQYLALRHACRALAQTGAPLQPIRAA